jgi:hypothetical protein
MKIQYFCRLIFTIVIFTSCSVQNNSTSLPIAKSTFTPTITSTNNIVNPSSTISPSKTPTLTSIPTLIPEIANETFVKLIESDEECKLPCWLRTMPGQTKFSEVQNYLSQFNDIFANIEFSRKGGYIRVFLPNFEIADHSVTSQFIPVQDGNVDEISISANITPDLNGKVNYSNQSFRKIWARYSLSDIFTHYGTPEKIFLDTTRLTGDPTTRYPFVLWIVYPQQGFLIRYEGDNSQVGNTLRICPMQTTLDIKIWDYKKSSYEEFIKNDGALSPPFSLGPQPIENVTEFIVESFYETFKDAEFYTCFDTPASLWPPN